MKKRLLAVLVAAVTAVSLLACGGGSSSSGGSGSADAGSGDAAASDMKVAMVTDYGDITDQSFNQTTYEACKAFTEANKIDFTYYKPEGDSTAEREAMIDKAVADGYNVLVLPGYAFAEAIVAAAETYPEVKFVALDVSEYDLCTAAGTDTYSQENVYSAVYQEEISGYMAGYAAVKMGYKKLGFLGGMAVPAVIRYGYGFVQGADKAAAELGIQVEINYTYGGQFFGDAAITAKMEGWYSTGTQIVFACGGGIYTSAVEAANKYEGKVIGVDVDQYYIDPCIVTSAMKGLQNVTESLLADLFNGNWEAVGGQVRNYSLAEGDYVGLPTAEASWRFNTFSADDYAAIYAAVQSGEAVVSADTENAPAVTNATVNYIQ